MPTSSSPSKLNIAKNGSRIPIKKGSPQPVATQSKTSHLTAQNPIKNVYCGPIKKASIVGQSTDDGEENLLPADDQSKGSALSFAPDHEENAKKLIMDPLAEDDQEHSVVMKCKNNRDDDKVIKEDEPEARSNDVDVEMSTVAKKNDNSDDHCSIAKKPMHGEGRGNSRDHDDEDNHRNGEDDDDADNDGVNFSNDESNERKAIKQCMLVQLCVRDPSKKEKVQDEDRKDIIKLLDENPWLWRDVDVLHSAILNTVDLALLSHFPLSALANTPAGEYDDRALHVAVKHNWACIPLLLASGAKPNMSNKMGLTPREVLSKTFSRVGRIAAMLLSGGLIDAYHTLFNEEIWTLALQRRDKRVLPINPHARPWAALFQVVRLVPRFPRALSLGLLVPSTGGVLLWTRSFSQTAAFVLFACFMYFATFAREY